MMSSEPCMETKNSPVKAKAAEDQTADGNLATNSIVTFVQLSRAA